MKNLLARSIGLVATTAVMAGSAAAADLKAAQVYKAPPPIDADPWTGFYGGLNAGGAIGRNHTTDTESTANAVGLLPIIGGDNVNHAPVGGVFGAQLGWNWHAAPSWVLGLEADAQWARQSEGVCISACLPPLGPGIITLLGVVDQQSLKWFGTARGRVGWVAPNGSLWYATGGAAWGRVQDTVTLVTDAGFLADGAPNAATVSHNRLGWTLGGGVEAPFAPHWTAKAEYLYVDLGHVTDSFTTALSPVLFPGGTMTTTNSYSFHDHIVRLGVNYHFGEDSGAMASAAPAYTKALPAAPMAWNGFYAGLNGGGSLARNHTVDRSLVPGIVPPDFGNDDFRHSPFGAIAGGQVGFNWQPARSWMLGLEADMQWSGERDTACISQCLSVGAPAALTLLGLTDEQSMTWFGTARGRFGWVAPNGTLWYATGGLAWGHVEQTLTLNGTPGFLLGTTSTAASFSHTKVGWTVGAGVEAPLWNGWSAKAEYLYVDLGSVSDTFSLPLDPGVNFPTIITNSSYTIHDNIVRIGVNYHLR